MFFYQKQVVLLSLFLLFIIIGGLLIISINMSKITQREVQDFIYLSTKGEGLWEVRLLGSSSEISKASMHKLLRGLTYQIEQSLSKGGASIAKIRVYILKQLAGIKNRQEDRYPIK